MTDTRDHLHIVVPGLTPPSVNDYVRHTRTGIHYKTKEAKGFHDATVMFARQAESEQGELPKTRTTEYEVMLVVFLGKGDRGDIDNMNKVPIDALVKARVITSDARVIDGGYRKRRDWKNPRTEIWVREADPEEYPQWQ